MYFRSCLSSFHADLIILHNNIGLGLDELSAGKTLEGCHAPVTKEPIFFFRQNTDTLPLFLTYYSFFLFPADINWVKPNSRVASGRQIVSFGAVLLQV
jgi:hypothetical protein